MQNLIFIIALADRYTAMQLSHTIALNIQQQQEVSKGMGCGAVCGNSSSVSQNSKEAETRFRQLFATIAPNQYLFPVATFAKFAKEMELNPHRFQLVVSNKIEAKCNVPIGVMEKWKIILFGLDFHILSYVNCLGYPQNALKPKPNEDNSQAEEQAHDFQPAGQPLPQMEIIEHQCFSQIEKDLDRTFSLPELQKNSFSQILKRISNHFPAMGYTQGINFIVGYLLIVGYSEFDSFWIFTHIALNRRYMLLGLFEDGFPLSNVYTLIFKNMLRRHSSKLYAHLYEDILIDESLWVFKWFITCYLYSFPLEMCQYIWDIVISIGGIGLVTFAVALVSKIESQLLQLDDPCDISEFFQSLKQIDKFNECFNIRQVVKMAYQIQMQQGDLEGLNNLKTSNGEINIYAKYFILYFKEQLEKQKTDNSIKAYAQETSPTKDQLNLTDQGLFKKQPVKKSQQILNQWYNKLIKERKKFLQRSPLRKRQTIQLGIEEERCLAEAEVQPTKCKVQKERTSIANNLRSSLQQLSSPEVQILEEELSKLATLRSVQNACFQNEVYTGGKLKSNPSSIRFATRKNKKEALWEDEQDEIEEKNDKFQLEDEFYYQPKDIKFKKKCLNAHEKVEDILTIYSGKSQPEQAEKPKNFAATKNQPQLQLSANLNQNRFVRAGQSVLSNMSVSNASNKSSASSRKGTMKQIHAVRHCKCNKNKTEQNQNPSINLIEKRKIQKFNQPEQTLEQSFDDMSSRKRNNTHHDWMISSEGPKMAQIYSNSRITTEIVTEIEIFHGNHMFKKKNKANKIGGGVGVISNMNSISEKQGSDCASRREPKLGVFQEQSCDSLFICNASQRKSEACEVESIK